MSPERAPVNRALAAGRPCSETPMDCGNRRARRLRSRQRSAGL